MYSHAQAPVRIGIAGGGTDLPVWTKERQGLCLSLAIKSYTHAVAIDRPDGAVVASYRNRDVATAATEIANGLIRESALMYGWEDGFEVHTLSELSSRGTGLGVSSSIAVSLAACFHRLSSMRRGVATEPRWSDGGAESFRESVARNAWTVEIEHLRRPIGRQDHMAATYGGLRLYSFQQNEATITQTYSPEHAAWLARYLQLLPLPEGHDSRGILTGMTTPAGLESAFLAVDDAQRAIVDGDAKLLGRALRLGHTSKLKIRGAVPKWLAALVETVERLRGVYGCKVTGAGGGGHLVIACEPWAVPEIETATHLRTQAVVPDLTGVRSDGWL
jgi:D-glycero-alpha-D-manno-heptose-7-phosphate kinase